MDKAKIAKKIVRNQIRNWLIVNGAVLFVIAGLYVGVGFSSSYQWKFDYATLNTAFDFIIKPLTLSIIASAVVVILKNYSIPFANRDDALDTMAREAELKESKKTKKTIDGLIRQTQMLFVRISGSIKTINQSPFLPDNKATITAENLKIKQWRQEIANSIAAIDPLLEVVVNVSSAEDVWVSKTRETVGSLKKDQAAFL